MTLDALIPTHALQKIPSSSLQDGKLLGKGTFGEVFLGKWNGKEVAIKKLGIQKLPEDLLREFKREAKAMALCNTCDQIVKLFGVCMEDNHLALIMEYLKGGSLYHLLRDTKVDLPWKPLRYRIAIDIGKGLAFLHERNILHRDMKSLNVLLDENLNAKICDFGQAKVKTETTKTMIQSQHTAGTIPWHAPELWTNDLPTHTKASDVYSYGMVLWEIASRSTPFRNAVHPFMIVGWLKQGKQEKIPENCPDDFRKLIEQACSLDPVLRPTAEGLVDALENIEVESIAPLVIPDTVPPIIPPTAPAIIAPIPVVIPTPAPAIISPVPVVIPPPAPAIISPVPVVIPPPAPATIWFGKTEWEKYIGTVGVEPSLPVDIDKILQSPCPFWPGKKIQETHLLTLLPKTVNGKPVTLNNFENLLKKPKQGHPIQYHFLSEALKNEYGNIPIPTSYWILMTKDVIPGSQNKSFIDQMHQPEKIDKKMGPYYRCPKTIEAAISILIHYVRTKEYLFTNNKTGKEWTYTRCMENVLNNEWQVAVGGFGDEGLSFINRNLDFNYLGLAGVRILK